MSTEIAARVADSVSISSGFTATQVLRIPWNTPVSQKAKIRKIQITTTKTSGQIVMFWDADLSNTTPVTRGTGTIAGSYFNIALAPTGTTLSGYVATTLTLDENQFPAYDFNAGIAAAVVANSGDVVGITQVGVEITRF